MSGERKTLAVVGLGLIGASIAEAARKRYPSWKILGVSSPETIREALKIGLIDEGFEGYENAGKALEQCDIGFLCTPIDKILGMLEGWVKNPLKLKSGAVISDVGSTKTEICAFGEKAFPPNGTGVFIGSHPMAGSEKTGLRARDAHLFENAAWIISFNNQQPVPMDRYKFLMEFVQALGAHDLYLTPDSHDEIVAYASHLPQLLSTSLAAYVVRKHNRGPTQDNTASILDVVGGGFRDMTRIASSSHKVWRDILKTNQKHIGRILSGFLGALKGLQDSLPKDQAVDFFQDANELKGLISTSRKGFSSPTTEILVDLEDKPGALLHALEPLSKAGLNILDLEILKVREGEEGVLMMGFRKAGEAELALELLGQSGHKARLR